MRAFAAKQNEGVEGFIAASPNPAQTEPVEGGLVSADEAEAGMAQMRELFKETGSELYMGAGDREHD